MTSKLSQALQRKHQSSSQETTDHSELVRQQLLGGTTPDGWLDGFLTSTNTDDSHHIDFGTNPRFVPDEYQCRIDALRLRERYGFVKPEGLE